MTDATAERLHKMYFLQSEKSDVAFKVVDADDQDEKSTLFVAHKAIVTSRCEVFRRMLTNEMFVESKMENPVINGDFLFVCLFVCCCFSLLFCFFYFVFFFFFQKKGTTPDAFRALLYFLYTEHTLDGVEESLVDIMQLANLYGQARLLSLCELHLSKFVSHQKKIRFCYFVFVSLFVFLD